MEDVRGWDRMSAEMVAMKQQQQQKQIMNAIFFTSYFMYAMY